MASERFQRRIDLLLGQVEEAIDQLDWEVVWGRAHAVLALDPENTDAINFLASAERALRNSAPAPTTPSTTPARPTGFASSRYQVEQFLGEGGKKKEYRAHDTLLDRGMVISRELGMRPLMERVLSKRETLKAQVNHGAQVCGRYLREDWLGRWEGGGMPVGVWRPVPLDVRRWPNRAFHLPMCPASSASGTP